MAATNSGDVTQLLVAWRNGDTAAYNALIPLVYGELRRIARRQFERQALGGLLQPTALVHEAYAKLLGKPEDWQNRSHFYAIAAKTMRRILVEEYRRRKAQKREAVFVSLSQAQNVATAPALDVEALHQALKRLAALSPRQAKIIELKFFADLSNEAIADCLGLSPATVKREWRAAKAWLYAELT